MAGFGVLMAGCATSFAEGDGKAKKSASVQKAKGKVTNGEPVKIEIPAGKAVATVAGGCFWCVESIFTELKGVEKVVSGYSGGSVVNPTYEDVCSGTTGHAEAIQVTFDPKVIGYGDILRVFLTTHDPTTLNRQGADTGTQYRSAIFYHDATQREIAQKVIAEVSNEKIYDSPIVTEVTPFMNFYKAEDYHQKYYANNPNQGYCRVVIAPKVIKFRDKWKKLLK